jgi:HAD superfamily hydrolase (TIGR01459 family)
MKHIVGLREIADQFDLFLVDQYGVLHDGGAAYPGAVDGLARLASGGRKVVVLTNSGKSAAANLARLAGLGFSGSNLHAVLSSGEVAVRLVRSGALGPRFAIGADACVIGRVGDAYAFSPDEFRLVPRPQDADFLVFAGSDAPRTTWADTYRSMLTGAAQARVPAICINPDLTMIQDGELVPAPGAIARLYESLGGPVDYVGKPYPAIFDHAVAIAAMDAGARVVMIGDSPEHDVAGARAMGLSTLLVRTGIHRDLDEQRLLRFCEGCNAVPDFLTAAFAW